MNIAGSCAAFPSLLKVFVPLSFRCIEDQDRVADWRPPMARVDDGLLYLEAEGVAEDQLRRGLSAARQHIARSGVCIEDAMEAAAKWDREIAWEKGEAALTEELS